MNNCKIEIYENKQWVDYTKYMIASFKFANLLDEQLDEATVTLVKVPNKAYFKPLTRVKIIVENCPKAIYSEDMAKKIRLESDLEFKKELVGDKYKSYDERTTFYYDEDAKRITQTSIKEFLLANDTSIENPVGSNKYDHEIYLIEQTKYLERFIGDSITFTNALGTNRDLYNYINGWAYAETKNTSVPKQIQNFVKLTYPIGTIITLPTYDIIANFEYIEWEHYNKDNYNNNDNTGKVYKLTLTIKSQEQITAEQHIEKRYDSNKYKWKYYKSSDPTTDEYFEEITEFDLTLELEKNRTYEVIYKLEQTIEGSPVYVAYVDYLFGVANNVLPLKKWTITDICNRIFDTIEPLEKGTKPRFRLQGVKYNEQGEIVKYSDNSFYEPNSQAEKYDKILSPEFSFSQNTLREMLSQIGGFVHAEPRIARKVETTEDEYWEIVFDEYGSNELSHISQKPFVSAGYKTNINDYCTSLDSSAQNLVNKLDYAQGVAFEPFYCGESGKGIGIRTENTTMRISENDGSFIPTTFKNYMFKGNNQVRITYIPNIGEGSWDITPYIFEKDDYSILDSFAGVYPYSKSYALYYTQGTQNIYGLFFEAPHKYDQALEPYSIIKIIRAVTGNGSLELTLEEISRIRFSISYLPISNARIRTAKPYVIGGLPSTITYNQNANLVETNYYGENLKGIVSRLGNIEKTYTYHLAFMSEVPKVGTKFDDNYYISSVSTEVLPLYIRCTIGLSKDFNRLSEYIGISSEKRMWEVSKNASDRQSVYNEYLVIKRNYKSDGNNEKGHWNSSILKSLFSQTYQEKPINLVEVTTKDKKNNNIATICLPVISIALGNSILFTFGFQDNYSAGQKIEEVNIDNKTSIWSNYVSYADIYGRFYYLDINFINGEPAFTESNEYVGKNFPLADIDDENSKKPLSLTNYLYRKDSREKPQITYELCAVAEDENLIIGSALMKNCQYVNRNNINNAYTIYGFYNRTLNKFENEVDMTNAVFIANISSDYIKNTYITLPERSEDAKDMVFKAWAIVTPPQTTVELVEDEDGNKFEQVLSRGNELVLGCNGDYNEDEKIGFIVQGIRDIYDI